MYLIVNIIGLIVFLAIGVLFSKNRKGIQWKSIAIMVVLNLVLAWFLTSMSIGRDIVSGAAAGFNWLVQVAYVGIEFALPSWVHVKSMDFVTSALLPILLIVPLFDILTYIGVLPFIIKWIGKGLSFITGQPKFESFFAVEMMFLGNTEALAVSSLQLKKMKAERDVTLAMMSMSCVTASIIGAYIQMMPGQFILTAIPINIINAIIVTSLLNPVQVEPEEDTVATISSNNDDGKKEPFFSFLGDSILGAGRLILIITANVIAFVALAALIDKILQLVNPWLTLEHILGIIMYPFAWLLGLSSHDSFQMAQYMGTKLVTNEFVVMGKVTGIINKFDPHFKAVLTVFVTSFANFSTLGMIIGCFKGIVDKGKNDIISKNVGYMLLSGILVSLLSAAFVGLFVW
ncbi:NupC/NupG family nucleoside CNT transporter [Companilactobacillus sp.]|jgi:CNT family concentrative nucleoside transporter/purine nucleoside transport protein|uniref:NupC/NupG family nucleoside CNT transporter n=1 Tax=Companilactobacillus sp. TaxID=2767905 RepID=UPI0025C0581D|nr:nucleoside transporter C-terminal domain-containing protein [Companilactobacillus sp.]MCH4008357.1 NupC/NupG family nucleoside CNT transporter [Companilactobacillus sp.]MCH4051464.1 NupC/NupG family nucleoside CNT transporter [Companilactobacillus sp.]MCH4076300.1 NupC/NupG family nucleoside CNT transporter [Companilactobacillus sp.]MCH4124875.1 NupC/NupG family nucleoside CNT transporter [Companilactobacillus sp.]MCH4131417.1 NupC/NupG family nucleoside CNT transporter [Companilactobacillu